MKSICLEYDKQLSAQLIKLNPSEEPRTFWASPLKGIYSCLTTWSESFRQFWESRPDLHGISLYYLLMEGGRASKFSFFPVHDLLFLAANYIRYQIKRSIDLDPGYSPAIKLINWELLPAVLLLDLDLTIYLPFDKYSFNQNLPDQDLGEAIQKQLNCLLPNQTWLWQPGGNNLLTLGSIKSAVPKFTSFWPHYLEAITSASHGTLLASWDFLGLTKNTSMREQLMESQILQGILQLPKPRRQNEIVYPAILSLAQQSTSIRVAQITEAAPRPGELDQQKAISLVYGPGKSSGCATFSLEEIKKYKMSLLPSDMLACTQWKSKDNGFRLRSFAEILRCQSKREKIDDKMRSVSGFCSNLNGPMLICKEISLFSRDPETGFVDSGKGSTVYLRSTALDEKYFLRKNDIVIAFRGTRETLGEVGLVAESPKSGVIPGQSLCIIRAFGEMDPIWLYYHLRQKDVQETIKNRSAGLSILNLSLELLRDLPIAFPSRQEINLINTEHQKLVAARNKIHTLRLREKKIMCQISEIINGDIVQTKLIDNWQG